MDFFISKDWLNRNLESYAFKFDHILLVVILLLIGFFAAFYLMKKDKKKVEIVLIVLWIVYTISMLSYYCLLWSLCIAKPNEYQFNISSMLPLHSCNMLMFVFPLAVFVKNKIIRTAASNFLVVVNMIMGFITLFVGCPPVGYSAFSFSGVHSILYHALDVIIPLIMLTTRYYDLQKNDVYYGMSLFGILALAVWIFDATTGSDYFYHYDGHTFPVFKFISENVPAIVWTLIIVSCYVITGVVVHIGVVFAKYLVDKKQNKTIVES